MKSISKYLGLFWEAVEIIFFQLLSIFHLQNKLYMNLWLFCERGYDAQDNAWAFFQFVNKNHPKQNKAFLLNNKNVKLYQKVQEYGRIIQFKSFQHKMAFTLCTKSLSTHIGFVEPWNHKLFKMLSFRKHQYIFLQHGVTYNDVSKYLKKSISEIDIFTVTSDYEFEKLCIPKYQFTDQEVKITGFARFDRLYDNRNLSKNEILFFPTWRRDLMDEGRFIRSKYYENIISLIHNKELIKLLNDSKLSLNLILHPEFQKYQSLFSNLEDCISIIDIQNVILQDIIINSKLLITDFSSVFFDFAYVNKPILFYDIDEFRNYSNDGFDRSQFGSICNTEEDLVENLHKEIERNYKNSTLIAQNESRFFKYRDADNCKRIYENI